MGGTCGGCCPKCSGMKWLILGVLILINAYWPVVGWWQFVGIIFVLKGFMLIVKPSCGCPMPAGDKSDKKKK